MAAVPGTSKMSNTEEISCVYDKEPWVIDKTYVVKVTHLYDPSKLWIVTKFRELEFFHKSICKKYSSGFHAFTLRNKDIKLNMYVVVFTEGGYYRGLVKNVIYSVSGKIKVQVLLIDFGYCDVVDPISIYKMWDKLKVVPSFSIRATICNVMPAKQNWTSDVVQRVHDLLKGQSSAIVLRHMDKQRRILYINLGVYDENLAIPVVTDIGKRLIVEGTGKPMALRENVNNPTDKFYAKTNYIFYFPTHAQIEDGDVPSTIVASELLIQTMGVAADKLYPNLYEKNPDYLKS